MKTSKSAEDAERIRWRYPKGDDYTHVSLLVGDDPPVAVRKEVSFEMLRLALIEGRARKMLEEVKATGATYDGIEVLNYILGENDEHE